MEKRLHIVINKTWSFWPSGEEWWYYLWEFFKKGMVVVWQGVTNFLPFDFLGGEFYLLLIYGVLGYCFHIRVFFLILIWCCIQLLAYVICIVVVNNFLWRLTISLRFIGGNCWVLREAILIVVNLHLQPIAFYSWKLHLLPITHGGLNALLIFQ